MSAVSLYLHLHDLVFAKQFTRRQFVEFSVALVLVLALVVLSIKRDDDRYLREWRETHRELVLR